MALLINNAKPAGADAPSTLDNEQRTLRIAVQDIFGIPNNQTISNAAMSFTTGGLATINLTAASATAGTVLDIAAGHAQRDLIASVGMGMNMQADTWNVNAAGNSETVAVGALAFFGIPTWSSTGTSFTVTEAGTLVIAGAPAATGGNVTISTAHALWVQAGSVKFAGTLEVTGATTMTGVATHGDDVVSDTDSTDDLGTSSTRWANVFTDNLGDSGQALTINSSAVLAPNIPLFIVNTAGVDGSVTGDGTVHTMVFATEITDQGSNFDGTSTFTAPVTGTYLLTAHIQTDGIAAGHTIGLMTINTSNRAYALDNNPVVQASGGSTFSMFHLAVLADMDASDTATVTLAVAGGAKAVGVTATAAKNYFTGMLVA